MQKRDPQDGRRRRVISLSFIDAIMDNNVIEQHTAAINIANNSAKEYNDTNGKPDPQEIKNKTFNAPDKAGAGRNETTGVGKNAGVQGNKLGTVKMSNVEPPRIAKENSTTEGTVEEVSEDKLNNDTPNDRTVETPDKGKNTPIHPGRMTPSQQATYGIRCNPLGKQKKGKDAITCSSSMMTTTRT